ncbi:MAG TPA: aminotransferase class V-fold PLP-dependent enzyme [Planctomycetota bacterium]|nr:aminotransferase class V-fold PLP-dependent enzyme [Planctomycetota bacterium]
MSSSSLPPLPPGFDAGREFPILKRWAFFNHAGVAPICRPAAEALNLYTQQALEDSYVTGNWYGKAETTRALAAELIHAAPEEIAFVKNTSEGLAFVANGLDWKAGDEILSTAVEYPANVYPWMDVAARFNARHIMVPERNGRIELSELLNAVTPKTRMIALSHVEYASGYRNDIQKVGEFCRSRGILFCVDAIQSLGIIPVDVAAMKIDFLSADGHKWMLAPEGFGFFYCRRELLTSLRPEVGWWNVVNAQDYGNYDFTLRPDAKRFECGSYTIPCVLALGASLKMILDVGVDLIGRRIRALTQQLCDGLTAKGYNVYSSRAENEWSGIVTFTHPSHDMKAIVRDLMSRKIVIVMREGRLRASPHFYNTPEQIDQLLSALP